MRINRNQINSLNELSIYLEFTKDDVFDIENPDPISLQNDLEVLYDKKEFRIETSGKVFTREWTSLEALEELT